MNRLLKLILGGLAVLLILFIGIQVGQGSGPEPTFRHNAKERLITPATIPEAGGGPLGIDEDFAETPTEQIANEMIKTSGDDKEGGSISERLVIKTGNLSLLVKNTQQVADQTKQLASELGGFVLSARTYFTDEKEQHLKGEITIKVPQVRFNEAITSLKGLALKTKSEHIQGRDVTEEYTDLESRLRNLEATETQLLEIMKRSGKITEVLEVQRELTRIREQIEVTKGRMKYLNESAQMSTITIFIATEEEELPVVEEKWRPFKVAKAALRQTVTFWQNIGSGLIWTLVFGAPLLLLGGVSYLISKTKRRPPHPA